MAAARSMDWIRPGIGAYASEKGGVGAITMSRNIHRNEARAGSTRNIISETQLSLTMSYAG